MKYFRIEKMGKFIFSAFLILLLTVWSSISVMGESSTEYTVDEIGVTLSLPSSMTVVTRSTSSNDEALASHNTSIEDFLEYGVYLQGYSQDGTQVFSLTMNQDSSSKEVVNYNKLEENQLAEIKESYSTQENCQSCSMDKYNGIIYFDTILSSTDENGKTVHMTQADTVVDGKYYHYILQSADGEISESDKALMTSVLESVKYKNSGDDNTNSAVMTFVWIVLTALIVVVIALVIFMLIKKKRREAALRAIDNRLYAGDKRERMLREEARQNRNTATGAERPDAFFDGVDGYESSENMDKLERQLIRDAHRQAEEYSQNDYNDNFENSTHPQNSHKQNRQRRNKKKNNTKRNNSSREF